LGEVDAVTRQPLRLAIRNAERMLSEAGIQTPRVDAELLAAHVLGVARTALPLVPLVDAQVLDAIGRLVAQRARRVPLQHLTGWTAMGGVDVMVGPGVFVPRPETELLFAWGVHAVRDLPEPCVVDLCTGCGVLAIALAHARPDAVVHGVDRDPAALAWARRNAEYRTGLGDTPVRLVAGDVADPALLADLEGQVDLVVCNPPYVPAGAEVPAEVADHDPAQAVFAGQDGLDVISRVADCAARLLRAGGQLAIEHDDTHGESVRALLSARRVLTAIEDHQDLAGRPRYVTATRVRSG
jgi:release factor glutamine methyltransferase